MVVDIPAQVFAHRLDHGPGAQAARGRDVMLEPALADERQQILKPGNLENTVASEGIERIVRELSFTRIGGDTAVDVVGRDAAIRERPGADASDDRAIRVLLANGSRDDSLEIHPVFAQEIVLGA